MTQATESNATEQHLLNLITELLQVLELEQKTLKNETDIDLEEISDRKLQLLASLSRAKRDANGISPSTDLSHKVNELRKVLEENRRALEIHIRAVNDVANTITGVIKDHESDGTYTSRQFGMGSY